MAGWRNILDKFGSSSNFKNTWWNICETDIETKANIKEVLDENPRESEKEYVVHTEEEFEEKYGTTMEEYSKEFGKNRRKGNPIESIKEPEKVVAIMNSKYIENFWDKVYLIIHELYNLEKDEGKSFLSKVDIHHLMSFESNAPISPKAVRLYNSIFLRDAISQKDFELAIKVVNVLYDTYIKLDKLDLSETYVPFQSQSIEQLYDQLEKIEDIDSIEKLLNSKAFLDPMVIADCKDDLVEKAHNVRVKILQKYQILKYNLAKKHAESFIDEKLASIDNWNKEELKNQIIDFIQKLNGTLQDHQKNTYAKEISFYVATKFAEKGFYYEAGESLAKYLKLSNLEK